MRNRILILLTFILLMAFAPSTINAQCLQNLTATVEQNWIKLGGEATVTGTATKFQLIIDDDSAFGSPVIQGPYTSGVATAGRWFNHVSIGPATKVYLQPLASDVTGTTYGTVASCEASLCPSGAGAQPDPDIVCEDVGGTLYPTITTTAALGDISDPTAPIHTRTLSEVQQRPTLTGSVFTVAGDCSDLQKQLSDAADADPNLNHEVHVQPGSICRPELENSSAGVSLDSYRFDGKTGTGIITVLCDYDAGYEIPEGVQFTPGLVSSQTCRFQPNRTRADTNGITGNGGGLFRPSCFGTNCSPGWRFEGFMFEPGDWRDYYVNNYLAVSSVDSALGKIVFGSPHATVICSACDLTFSLPGLTGTNTGVATTEDSYARGLGIIESIGVGGTWTNNASEADFGFSFDGTYTSGGYVSITIGTEIDSCTSGANPTCTLVRDHHMSDYAPMAISSMTSGVITIPSGHGLNYNATIVISGNSACDGIYDLQARAATTVTLHGSTCSGTGGTVQRLHTALFFELVGTGASELQGVYPVYYTGADTLQVIGPDLTGLTITGGGYSPETGASWNSYIVFGSTDNWSIDRCLFDGGGIPFRWRSVIGVGNTNNSSITNSWFRRFEFWRPLAPTRGGLDPSQLAAVGSWATYITGGAPNDMQWYNVTCEDCPAFVIGVTNSNGTDAVPSDVTIKKMVITMDKNKQSGSATALPNVGYNVRHAIETKAMQRWSIDGLAIFRNFAAGVGNAFALYFSCAGNTSIFRECEDVDIKNLWIDDSAAGVGLFWTFITRTTEWNPLQRVRIDNYLANYLPWRIRNARAVGQGIETPGPWTSFNGSMVQMWGPVRDIRMTRFSGIRIDSATIISPALTVRGDASGVQLTDSILSHSGTSTQGIYDIDGGSNETAWNAFANWNGLEDSYSYIDNVGIIPCLTASGSTTPNYTAANNAYTAANTAWTCSVCTQMSNITVTGADSESCATRESAVIDSNLEAKPAGAFAGLGYDKDEMDLALGRTKFNIAIDPNTLALTYTVPAATEVCTVDYSTSKTFASKTRLTDSDASTSRSVTLSGLTEGVRAYYRILCPGFTQRNGSFIPGTL